MKFDINDLRYWESPDCEKVQTDTFGKHFVEHCIHVAVMKDGRRIPHTDYEFNQYLNEVRKKQ